MIFDKFVAKHVISGHRRPTSDAIDKSSGSPVQLPAPHKLHNRMVLGAMLMWIHAGFCATCGNIPPR